MTEITYPLATSTWDDSEYQALQDVIASGRFTMGEKVREFEAAFAKHFGSKYAVMVNSGSSANLIAIAAAVEHPELDINPGDEVIVPAVSWATTYYPIHQLGLRLVFVDIDDKTLNLDLEKVKEAITPRTKAIFAVNLLGNPAPLKELAAIAKDNGIVLLEDNCESMGASIDGKFAGTFGLAGTFSTFFSHHISTMEGGVIVTDDLFMYQAMTSLRAHGWTRELPNENLVFNKTGDKFDDLFRFVLPGYNVRPLEMSGALGITQLQKVPSLVAGRQANGELFKAAFADNPNVQIQEINGESSWFGFSMIFTGALKGRRKEIVDALTEVGIECRPIVAGNFARNPVVNRLNAYVPSELLNSDKAHFDGLFVGNHHYPINREISLLEKTIQNLV